LTSDGCVDAWARPQARLCGELLSEFQAHLLQGVLPCRPCESLFRSNIVGTRRRVCGRAVFAPGLGKGGESTSRRPGARHRARETGSFRAQTCWRGLVLRTPIFWQAHGRWRSNECARQQCREPDPAHRNSSPSTARKIGITPRIGVAKVVVAPITVPLPAGRIKRGQAAVTADALSSHPAAAPSPRRD